MRVMIESKSFKLTKALKDYAAKRLNSALTKSQSRLQYVMVRLSDVNGPRGGEDKVCHVHAVLPG